MSFTRNVKSYSIQKPQGATPLVLPSLVPALSLANLPPGDLLKLPLCLFRLSSLPTRYRPASRSNRVRSFTSSKCHNILISFNFFLC